jgi:very-short-patch-repair endonuclease
VLVLVPIEVTARSVGFVRVRRTRRLPGSDLHPGPRRVPPARAVADLALESTRLDDVRTLVAQSIRARLCSVDELRAELEQGPRRGSAHLRTALDDVSGGSWSAPEAAAARLLRGAKVPPFEQNAAIVLPDGRRYYADFLWRRLRAVLEIDSVAHHLDPRDWRATMDRHFALETLGYAVVHRTPRDVAADPAGFAAGIEQWLLRRARDIHR